MIVICPRLQCWHSCQFYFYFFLSITLLFSFNLFLCCVNDCNVETHANIFVWNISLLVEARANIPTLFMINLKFTKSILVPIILFFPWLLYAHDCNADTHANFISKCVVGTVSVKSVYTCTAQTVQSSRSQGSHHRTFLKDLEGSMENWIRNDNMNERISTCRSRAYYVSTGQKLEWWIILMVDWSHSFSITVF